MVNIIGVNIPTPDLNLTGFFSGTWIYILIIGFIGIALILTLVLVLFFRTYNRRVIIFENISGQGYQPVLKTRARVIRLGTGGEEVLKTIAGKHFLSAYGRKMGKNTYWYAKGSDGYLYNIILGDLDTKMAMLDIEPIDRDVRMFHVAIDRLSDQTYGKHSFLEKYGVHLMLFLFLIVLILGMWFIIGKVGNATNSLSNTAETNAEVAQTNREVLVALNNILSQDQQTGVTPAPPDIPIS